MDWYDEYDLAAWRAEQREGAHRRDPDALGSCGCTDYHMADCPTRTG